MKLDAIQAFATQYLHEDWEEDHPDFTHVLATFIDETDRSDQIALGKAFNELLDATTTEEETEDMLRDLDWQVFFEGSPIRDVLADLAWVLLKS